MEHDIRNLFKKDEISEVEIPPFHKEEFIKKLNSSKQNNKKYQFKNNYKVSISVAVIIVFMMVLLFPKNDTSEENKTLIQTQIATFEKEYLTNINNEWQQFIKITDDTVLINKYKKKLQQFSLEYKKLTLYLKESPNNILVLETLVSNLQQRLQLLKGIQKHIKELTQKNKSNETIYL